MKEITHNESELVKKAHGGCDAAFESLLKLYAVKIISYVSRLTGNRRDAEDIAQEVFMKAYKGLSRFDTEKPFSNWLFTIAHNTAVNHLRAQRPHNFSLDEALDAPTSGQDNPATCLERKETKEKLTQTVDALPLKYKEAITLFHLTERSYEDISTIMDVPIGTVKTLIHRGRELLRKKLVTQEVYHGLQ